MATRTLAKLRVAVTGASQGIGRALAAEAARRGAKVLAMARSADALAQLAAEAKAAGGELVSALWDGVCGRRPDARTAGWATAGGLAAAAAGIAFLLL